MALSYSDIQRKIQALKAEVARQQQHEMGEVIERIRGAIAHYGITAADLGLAAQAPRAAAPAAPAASGVVYRDAQGRTWGGRGKRPNWLREALAEGRDIDEFRVAA